MDAFKPRPVEAEPLQGVALYRVGEEAHHHLLAVVGGEYGDAKRDLGPLRIYFKATVLGEALFIQAQAREHFNARNDAGTDVLRQDHGIVENAVNAVADDHFPLVLLNVDVGRLLNDRMGEQGVHDAHNGQVLGHFFERFFALFRTHILGKRSDRFGLFLDDVAELGLETLLVLDEGLPHTLGVGESRKDAQPHALFYKLNCLEVFRVQHGNLKRRLTALVGDNVVLASNRLGNSRKHGKIYFLPLK